MDAVLCRNLTAFRMVALKMLQDLQLQHNGFHKIMQSSQNPGDLVSQTTGSSLGLNCGEHVPPQNTESTLDPKLGDMDPQNEDSSLVLGPGALIRSPSSVYQLDSLLGSGVYGHVLLCRNLTADRMVAIKMFRNPQLQHNGFHEMHLLQFLAKRGAHNHHIVRWFSSFVFLSHFCHEFEELDISLNQLLQDSPSKRLTLREIRPIVFQMAQALLFLKRVGVMHCDLKPDNIMMIHHVQQPLRIKIIDFGLSCLTTTATQGELRQTLHYRAPEVLLGAPVQEAIDMWSVGCIAAEMFLGAILFGVKNEEALVKHIVERVGHPPTTCLDQGLYTSHFYQCCPLTHQWQYKLSSLDPAPHMIKDLHDIKTRGSTGDSTEDHDHFVFMDLVKSMLDVDPETRHTPAQVLKHPFIRMSHLAKRDPAYLAQSRRTMFQAYGRVPNRKRGNPSSSVSSALPTESPPTATTSQGQTLKGKCEEQVCQEIRDTSSPAKSRTSSQSPQVPPGFCPLPVHRSAPETNGSTTQGHLKTFSSSLPARMSSLVSSPLPSGGRKKRTNEEDLDTTVTALTSPFLPNRRMAIVQEDHNYDQKTVSSRRMAIVQEDHIYHQKTVSSRRMAIVQEDHNYDQKTVSSRRMAIVQEDHKYHQKTVSSRKITSEKDREIEVIDLTSPVPLKRKKTSTQGHPSVSSPQPVPTPSAVSSHRHNHQKIVSPRKRASEEDLETVVIDLTSPFPLKSKKSSTQCPPSVSSPLCAPMTSAVSSLISSPLPSGGKRKRNHEDDLETTVIDLKLLFLPKRRMRIVQDHGDLQYQQKTVSSKKRESEEDPETVIIDLTSPSPKEKLSPLPK